MSRALTVRDAAGRYSEASRPTLSDVRLIPAITGLALAAVVISALSACSGSTSDSAAAPPPSFVASAVEGLPVPSDAHSDDSATQSGASLVKYDLNPKTVSQVVAEYQRRFGATGVWRDWKRCPEPTSDPARRYQADWWKGDKLLGLAVSITVKDTWVLVLTEFSSGSAHPC